MHVKAKSAPVTVAGFLQTNPLILIGLVKSATQKSLIGSASVAITTAIN
jgi:hypothetical protein